MLAARLPPIAINPPRIHIYESVPDEAILVAPRVLDLL